MKKLLFSISLLIVALASGIANATPTQYTWLALPTITSNCTTLTGTPALTKCLESDNLEYDCYPSGGVTSTCQTPSDWKLVGGYWVDNGVTISMKNQRNLNIGTGYLMGDPTLGITLNPSGDGVTIPVSFLPNGLMVTQSGIQYVGPDAFANFDRPVDRPSPNTGDMWFNTSILGWVYWNGIAYKRIPTLQIYANTFQSPTSSMNRFLLRAPVGLKIESINCIVDTGSIPITIQSCSSTGTSCSNINTSITCSSTGGNDGGLISTPNITSGNYVNLNAGSTSGSPTSLNVTVTYSQNEP
jgi:hypothetical protein